MVMLMCCCWMWLSICCLCKVGLCCVSVVVMKCLSVVLYGLLMVFVCVWWCVGLVDVLVWCVVVEDVFECVECVGC